MVVYIYYITAAGNSISSQLSSSCQGKRDSTEKTGGTDGPSRTKSILKVVGNEKEGGSGKWQMIDIGLGLW